MNTSWSKLVSAYLRVAAQRPLWIVLAATMLGLGGLWAGQNITVNSRLEALLPADSPALPAIEEMRARVPSSSPYYLLVNSPDAALNRALAEKLKEGVSRWPETRFALDRRDPTFFLDRRLLFLPAKEIQDLAYQVEDIVDFEECAAVPGCVNLDSRPPNPSEAELQKQLSAVPEVNALMGLFGLKELPAAGKPPAPTQHAAATTGSSTPGLAGTPPPAEGPTPAAQRSGVADAVNNEGSTPADAAPLGTLCSPNGQVCAVTVFLDGSPSNLEYSERILSKTQSLFEAVRPANAPASLKLASSGPYRNAPLTKRAVSKDLSWTAGLSTLLMVLLVAVQFRGARSFLLIFGPLVYAALWSAGIIGLVHPELNLISAFTLAVLAGLGIDFGVHMLTHYGSERQAGHDVSSALKATYDKLGGPMAMACVTSGCGFGALMAADFRGFAEMGGLAALGVALALVAFLVVFPALAQLSHRLVPERAPLVRPLHLRFPRVRRPARAARWLVLVGALLAVASGALGTQVDFEYNFRNLQPETVSHGIRWKTAMHGTSRSAVVMMADTPQALERSADKLRRDFPERAAAAETWLLTPASFVPPEQTQRLEALDQLRTAVARAKERLSAKDRSQLDTLEPLLAVDQPITPEQLPEWVRQWLTDTNGVFGTFGLMYHDLRGSDAHAMEDLANELGELRSRYPELRFASGDALLGLIVPGLRRDAPKMIGLALLGLFVGTLAIGRSLTRAFTVLLPLALSTCCALALMVAFDLRVNLYNMLVFPLSFGIGIDGAVYVVWAMSEYDPKHTPQALATTARGVLGSTLTTAAGFGSMVVASNPGLVSLGALAVTTLLCSLAGNLLWLPAFMYLRKGPPDAPGGGLYLDQTSETRAL